MNQITHSKTPTERAVAHVAGIGWLTAREYDLFLYGVRVAEGAALDTMVLPTDSTTSMLRQMVTAISAVRRGRYRIRNPGMADVPSADLSVETWP
jgi:hypothetical protein